jgi:hypothetical protein
MAPTFELPTLTEHALPLAATIVVLFEYPGEIDAVDISEKDVVQTGTSCNDVEVSVDENRAMESPLQRANCRLCDFDLAPLLGLEVEDPQIVEVDP